MKIRKLVIKNYRGVRELDLSMPPCGAVVRGRNGAGKSTVLKAVQAALLARDVGPDAIRRGADKSEILVDLDDVSVRRAITANGTTVTVTRDGMRAQSPQTFLRDLLGTSSLDPMDLLLKKGKERRLAVLAAFMVTVTLEFLRRFVPRLPDSFDCSGHGLEVIERVRAKAYTQRTDANAAAKAAKAEMERLAVEAKRLEPMNPDETSEVEERRAEHEEAKALLVELRARVEEGKRAEARTASARARVAELRVQATKARAIDGPGIEDLDAITNRRNQLRASVAQLEAALQGARRELDQAEGMFEAVSTARNRIVEAYARADQLDQQATELESTLAAAAVEPVAQEDLDAAEQTEGQRRMRLDQAEACARAQEAHRTAFGAAEAARQAWDTAAAEAGRLDGIVRSLTEQAPAELLAQCDGIPGLSLDGDDILLDGVRLDSLCGAEQVRFCVEVARRANAKSKILVVDGLERLDPEGLEVFVHEATRDSWQLIATRVDRGDVLIEAIEPEPQAQAAAE